MDTSNVEALKVALAKAKAEQKSARTAEAIEAALLAVLRAERELAAAEGRAYAVWEPFPLHWNMGAPLPVLVRTDNYAALFFLLEDVDDGAVGLVEFEGCVATSFGKPTEDTLHGHPLHGSGLHPGQLISVMNSDWIARLRQTESVDQCNPHPPTYKCYRHLIFAFHDSTFECVTESFKAARLPGPLSEAVRNRLASLL